MSVSGDSSPPKTATESSAASSTASRSVASSASATSPSPQREPEWTTGESVDPCEEGGEESARMSERRRSGEGTSTSEALALVKEEYLLAALGPQQLATADPLGAEAVMALTTMEPSRTEMGMREILAREQEILDATPLQPPTEVPHIEMTKPLRVTRSPPRLAERFDDQPFTESRGMGSGFAADRLPFIREGFAISEEYELLPAEPGDRVYTHKGDDVMCVHYHSLMAGLNIPPHPFMVSVFERWGFCPSQLSPNAYRNMIAYLRLCKEIGVEPLEKGFREFFFATTATGTKEFFTFSARGGQKFCQVPDSLPSSWKSQFFFVRKKDGPWGFPVKWAPNYIYKKRSKPLPKDSEELWILNFRPLALRATKDSQLFTNKVLSELATHVLVGSSNAPGDEGMQSVMIQKRKQAGVGSADRSAPRKEQRVEAQKTRVEATQKALSEIAAPPKRAPTPQGPPSTSTAMDTGAVVSDKGSVSLDKPVAWGVGTATIRDSGEGDNALGPFTKRAQECYEPHMFLPYHPDWGVVVGDTLHGDPGVAVEAWDKVTPIRDGRTIGEWSTEVIRGQLAQSLWMNGELTAELRRREMAAAREASRAISRAELSHRNLAAAKAKVDEELLGAQRESRDLKKSLAEAHHREVAVVDAAVRRAVAEERRALYPRLADIARVFAASPENGPLFRKVVDEFVETDHGVKAIGSLQESFFFHGVYSALKRNPGIDISGLHPSKLDCRPLAPGEHDFCTEEVNALIKMLEGDEKALEPEGEEATVEGAPGVEEAPNVEEGETVQEAPEKAEDEAAAQEGEGPSEAAELLPPSFVAALRDPVIAALLAAGRAETLEEAEKVPPFFQPECCLQMVVSGAAKSVGSPSASADPASPARSWHSPVYPDAPTSPLEAEETTKEKPKRVRRTAEEARALKRQRDAERKRKLRAEARERTAAEKVKAAEIAKEKGKAKVGGSSGQDFLALSDDGDDGGSAPSPKRQKTGGAEKEGAQEEGAQEKGAKEKGSGDATKVAE